jgi:hypothetical protein
MADMEKELYAQEPAQHIEKSEYGEAHVEVTVEEEERLIRKLDWHLLPLLFLLYSLAVLDRSNLGNAKIAGMAKDIDLTGYRYNWLGTVFYISCTLPGSMTFIHHNT